MPVTLCDVTLSDKDPTLRSLGATATNSGQDPPGDRPQSYGATVPTAWIEEQVGDIRSPTEILDIDSARGQDLRRHLPVTPGVISAIFIKVASSA